MTEVDTEYQILQQALEKLEVSASFNSDQVSVELRFSEIIKLLEYIHTLEWSLGLRSG